MALDERRHFLLADGENFGRKPGGVFAELGEQRLASWRRSCVRRIAQIFIALEAGIGVEPLRFLVARG